MNSVTRSGISVGDGVEEGVCLGEDVFVGFVSKVGVIVLVAV
jgi:hypothetical protein